MPTFRLAGACILAIAAMVVPVSGTAQSTSPDTAGPVRAVVPGPSYGAGALKRAIYGSGWRDVWLTPVHVPVLNIDTFAGGLVVDKRGGGFQTITLHLTERNGWQEWRFRSVDKHPMLRLPPELSATVVGRVIQDQTGNLFPAANLIVPPFVDAVGGLNVGAKLYVMGDNPRLGEHRATFAGMLGTMELKGEEAPDDAPGFAGSTKVKDTEKFFGDLEEDRGNRINEREFLAVRLIDFLINDTDRTPDNYDWARFGTKGDYLWRPISRDRDRAFTHGNGIVNELLVRRFYPKFTEFDTEFNIRGLMAAAYAFDRRLLQRLTRQDFQDVALEVQRAVTDSVIDAALAGLPPEWRNETTVDEELRSKLIARRSGLPEAALRFYEELAREPDIHLTNDDERADIVRHPNGEVTVSVAGTRPTTVAARDVPTAGGGATRVMNGVLDLPGDGFFYRRTFLPSETQEIRVYLGKGKDTAVVRGAATDSITIRVIGGEGDDILADSAGGGANYFYDAEGANRFISRASTHVSEKAWTPPEPVYGFTIGGAWKPDWGSSKGWTPTAKYEEGAGLVLGFGPAMTSYGFRRLPHHWSANAAFMVGTGNGKLGFSVHGDYRLENSPAGFSLAARASQLDAFRFYGYGNDTPDIGSDLSLVTRTVVALEPSIVWHVGWRSRESKGAILHDFEEPDSAEAAPKAASSSGVRPMVGRIEAGPALAWTDPEPVAGSPLADGSIIGGARSFRAGLQAGVDLEATDAAVPTKGWRLRANAAGYPLGVSQDAFGRATAMAATYLPLVRGSSVALRVGGGLARGDFPADQAALIGGSTTVRGYRWNRFAGDASTSGSVELRIPVGTVNFLIRPRVGVFGLADAGRVWLDGRSDGGWHTGLGGGVWFAAFGHAVSLSYAHGDETRFYLKSGLSF